MQYAVAREFESKVQGNSNVENAKLLKLDEKKHEALASFFELGPSWELELSELTFNGCVCLPCLVSGQALAIREVA